MLAEVKRKKREANRISIKREKWTRDDGLLHEVQAEERKKMRKQFGKKLE